MNEIREAYTEADVREAVQAVLDGSRFEELAAAERGLRTPPAGRKSEATFDHIVQTAAEVLDDVPLRDITTHLIADRADVNIATVYRYFSDLESILVEFDLRYQRLSLAGIQEMAIQGAFTEDRRAWSDEVFEMATVVRTDTPGAIGIARDGYAIPQVREITRAAELVAARMSAVATEFYAPGLKSENEWYEMYLAVIRATSKILDEACSVRPADLGQIEALKEMAFNFFEPHFQGR
ncbi:MAG: TetR/AcrR family transcriptional regulator [Solirubrobacteraceae bacterium]|nr:TetR/AcrR family transcriptional regulator [Solirubrobacteraceae bacterium]